MFKRTSLDRRIRAVAAEAQTKLDRLFGETNVIDEDSALNQLGLRDGLEIVGEYLKHGEYGLAFDHTLYMISEAELCLSSRALSDLARAGEALGVDDRSWSHLGRTSDP